MNVVTLSAVEQARLVRERHISAEELVEAHLQHIERINPALHAVTEIMAERARADARAAPHGPPRVHPLLRAPP